MNQPATSTILLRHGATALTGQRYSGRGDPELTDQGRAQASAAAARLATVPNIAAVISSPLRRARATAEAVAGRHRLPVQLDEDLIEADFGEFEGLSFEQARQRRPAEHAAWIGGRPDAAPPGGESVEQVAGRAERALRRVLVEHRGRTVVLVAHATPIKLLVCSALGGGAASFFRLQVDTGGLCWIDWYGPDTAVVRHLNDTGQLP